jgi:hypothetical protein
MKALVRTMRTLILLFSYIIILFLVNCSDDGNDPEIDLCIGIICQNGGICNEGVCECVNGYTGDNCEIAPSLTLQTAYGSLNTLEVVTDDIFAIWWDPAFDHSADVETMFKWLKEIRTDCKTNLGMADPPNIPAGHFFNVYIHHGTDDLFPNEWNNGVGTDSFGLPYLALPDGYHLDFQNVNHEAYHIFQYSQNSAGFAYSGDSQWFTEASANWYASIRDVEQQYNSFGASDAVAANPQLALWHSWGNAAPEDTKDWLFEVRQYGLNSWLYYLTYVKMVDNLMISGGYYERTEFSPQEYLFANIGADNIRSYFADWAVHSTTDFDYITEQQHTWAKERVDIDGDPTNVHRYIFELLGTDVVGEFSPPTGLIPRGWAYNVVKVENSDAVTYSLSLNGETTGSEGAASHFEARVAVVGTNGNQYINFTMSDNKNGTAEVTLSETDSLVYIVIASVPEHFTGNQTYNYTLSIAR